MKHKYVVSVNGKHGSDMWSVDFAVEGIDITEALNKAKEIATWNDARIVGITQNAYTALPVWDPRTSDRTERFSS